MLIQKTRLVEALSRVAPITSGRTTIPILNYIRLAGTDASLLLQATNLEVSVEQTIAGEIDEIDVCVPGKLTASLIGNMPDGEIELKLNNSRLIVAAGATNATLSTLPTDDFPRWEPDKTAGAAIDAAALAAAIGSVAYAASKSDLRFNLNTIYADPDGPHTTLVATDGHRLAMTKTPSIPGVETPILIPSDHIGKITAFLTSAQPLYLATDEKNIWLYTDTGAVGVRLLDGEYPPYRRLIPEDKGYVFTVLRAPLTQALRRCAIFTTDRNKAVTLTLGETELRTETQHPELGTATDTIETSYSGPPFTGIFNVFYLQDALASINGEVVNIYVSEALRPIFLTDGAPDETLHLVMPMRGDA